MLSIKVALKAREDLDTYKLAIDLLRDIRVPTKLPVKSLLATSFLQKLVDKVFRKAPLIIPKDLKKDTKRIAPVLIANTSRNIIVPPNVPTISKHAKGK